MVGAAAIFMCAGTMVVVLYLNSNPCSMVRISFNSLGCTAIGCHHMCCLVLSVHSTSEQPEHKKNPKVFSLCHLQPLTLIRVNVTRNVTLISRHASPIQLHRSIHLKFQSCHLGNHIWLDPDFKLTFVPPVKLWPSGLWIHTCQNNIYHLWSGCCSLNAVLVSFHPSLLPSTLLSSLVGSFFFFSIFTSIFMLSSYVSLSCVCSSAMCWLIYHSMIVLIKAITFNLHC